MLPSALGGVGLRCLARFLSTSSAQFSQVSDLRRAKQRKGWEPLVSDESASPSSDFLAFPRERLGNHYALNWALNSSKITPSGNAYRNLHLRGLLMLCSGAKEQNKAIRVDTRPGIAADDFIQVASKSPEFADTLRDVRRYFSHVPDIFVHDGEIGSKHTQSLSIRVIADSAATGLWCHHRISRIPLSDPRAFRPALTVYVATNIAKPPSVVCDLEAGVVVINNVNSTETLEQAILTAFSVTAPDTVAEKSFSILLKSSVFYPQPNHIDLIISSPSHPLPAAPADLFSSDATIWSSQGLSRVFEGYSLPNTVPPLPHALITSQQTTASFSTQPPPLIAAPTRVFVLGDNQKGVQTSRIPKDKVAEFATQIHPLLPQVIGDIACHRLSLSSSSSWAQIRSALLAQSKSK